MVLMVNNETIQRLTIDVGKETALLLLGVFSEELNDYFQQLSDLPTILHIREKSHAIKSSAASFGADELAEFACECENRVKMGQDLWVMEQFPRFLGILQETAMKYHDLALRKDLFEND